MTILTSRVCEKNFVNKILLETIPIKETIAEFMENGLEAELDEDLGYSKYDYKNKATATAAKICERVLAMSRFLFPVIGKVNLNRSF